MSNMTRFKLFFILLCFLISSTAGTTAKDDASYYGKQLLGLNEDMDYRQFIEGLQTMLKNKENRFPDYSSDMDLLNEHRKRQIRYHPCYFNPVSCFRKK